MRGFWAVVHYCEREECVNAGVIAGVGRKWGIRWARTDDRILHVFGLNVDLGRLASAKKAFANRLQLEIDAYPDDDVETVVCRFIGKEAGNLQITYPRAAVVDDLDETLKRLYGDYLA